MVNSPTAAHVAVNQRHWDEERAAAHGPLARDHWARTEPVWGLWASPESQVRMFPDDIAGQQAIELGCGTGYVSAWLARAGARPIGIDLSTAQLATASALLTEFGLDFPLLLADAERLPVPDATMDLAISDYGASLWCDPYRWIPEAARVLAPGGRLAFSRPSPLFAACKPAAGQATNRLLRPYFTTHRTDWGRAVEFNLPHGAMFRLLRESGFTVDDLIEIQAPRPAHRDYPEVSADWAHDWPSEEIWQATRTG
ncbi:class I SAM-dependent methyltransferase [Streptomyces profundus]|uniref:class I SAM-dependent methyltransferase n=1 Tax=Streptomyces profundus TaxID=2867410 RepID=UPI001D16D1A7|nr:class I SAM-dependent methyltransferase [Streptomyces sp. MA3_2.13]UED87159.1 class I SAM-dependent methyltransferase [Streptomyces sp. MA3_2.13]